HAVSAIIYLTHPRGLIFVGEIEMLFHTTAEFATVHRLQNRPPESERWRVGPALKRVHPAEIVGMIPVRFEVADEPRIFHELDDLHKEVKRRAHLLHSHGSNRYLLLIHRLQLWINLAD